MRTTVLLHVDDIRSVFIELDAAQRGDLFTAIVDYATEDKEPDFSKDKYLRVCWNFLRPRLDADGKKLADITAKREYASYCSREKRNNRTPLTRDEWDTMRNHAEPCGATRNHADSTWNPYTNTSTNTNTITNTSTSTSTSAEDCTIEDAPAAPDEKEKIPPTPEDVQSYIESEGMTFDATAFIDHYEARGWQLNGSPIQSWRALCRSWQRREGTFATKGKRDRDRPYTMEDYDDGRPNYLDEF